jgi:uncharacterized protein (DUF2237 family)
MRRVVHPAPCRQDNLPVWFRSTLPYPSHLIAPPGLARWAVFLPEAGRCYAERRNSDGGPGSRANISALSPWIRHQLVREDEVVAMALAHHGDSAAENTHPMTGFYREGDCRTDALDAGRHVVAAILTQAFLDFTRLHGNDLQTPRPDADFPDLNPGDRGCLCARRWKEAEQAGVAPPVVLKRTYQRALDDIPLENFE